MVLLMVFADVFLHVCARATGLTVASLGQIRTSQVTYAI